MFPRDASFVPATKDVGTVLLIQTARDRESTPNGRRGEVLAVHDKATSGNL